MIEKTILDYLNGLPDAPAPALAEIPPGGITPPAWIIQRTGGGTIEGHVGTAMVAIQSYGESLYLAAELNGQIVRIMDVITEKPEIAACRLNSDYNFTDTAKKKYRYQAVFDLVYYDQEDS